MVTSLVGPPEPVSHPAVVVIVAGPPSVPNIGKYQELGIMLHDSGVPVTSFGTSWQSRQLLDVGSAVLDARFECQHRNNISLDQYSYFTLKPLASIESPLHLVGGTLAGASH